MWHGGSEPLGSCLARPPETEQEKVERRSSAGCLVIGSKALGKLEVT